MQPITHRPVCLLPHAAAPSKHVVAQLSTSSHGQQLLQIVRTLASQLLAQSILCPSTAAARGLVDNLQELHSCIVALDDMIDEQRISSGACCACLPHSNSSPAVQQLAA